MKEYLLKIINYNHWGTQILLEELEKNSLNDDYILKMLSHYLNAFYIRFDNICPQKTTKPLAWDVHTIEKLKKMNDDITEEMVSYLLKAKTSETNVKVHTLSTDGDELNLTKGDMFIHIMNHAAHHRGQICTKLRELGFTPPGIGYLRYVHSLPDFW